MVAYDSVHDYRQAYASVRLASRLFAECISGKYVRQICDDLIGSVSNGLDIRARRDLRLCNSCQ